MTLIKWKRSNSIFDIMDNYNIINNYLKPDDYNYYESEWNPSFNINEKEVIQYLILWIIIIS